MKKISKKGNILIENIIFIILNLIFLSILILFVYGKIQDSAVLEEKYAKQIALIIDSAKPGMIIHLDMKSAIDKAKQEGFGKNIVSIENNIVTVNLKEKKGYSYSFFNDVDVSIYPDLNPDMYIIKINSYR